MVYEISSALATHKQKTLFSTLKDDRFSALLEDLKQYDIVTLKQKATIQTGLLESSKSQPYQEDLQARFEIAQQEIKQESKKGLNPYAQPLKAVVGMVSQDFWRQAFSNAILENERNADTASFYEYADDAPILPSLLESEKQ